jgi:hypothetical protein
MTSAGVPPPQFAPSAPDGRTPTDLSAPTAHKEKSAANLKGFAPQTPQDLSLFSARVDGFLSW